MELKQLQDLVLKGPTLALGEINTLCSDPFAYANDDSTETATPDTGSAGETTTVTAAGTTIAYPTILFEASGTRTGLVMEHDALDTRLTYSGQLVYGDKLLVHCNPADWLVEKMPVGQDAYAAVMDSIDGQFPYLEVGANEFTIYHFSGDVTWTWKNRFV